MTINRILVPTDGSDPANRAIDYAAMLAKATGAKLEILTVVDLRQVDVYEGFYLTDEQLQHIETEAREKVLDAAKARVGEGVDVEVRLLKGPSTALILEEAEKADHVVVGRTGKNVLERFLEGSTSRGLALHCKVPVTIVA
jgi:nucleotide-binding universal stress UspA family protein